MVLMNDDQALCHQDEGFRTRQVNRPSLMGNSFLRVLTDKDAKTRLRAKPDRGEL